MREFVTIAHIVKVRGIRGEVAADILTDFPERFSSLRRVRVFRGGQEFWEELESCRFHRNRVLLKFKNRDRPEQVRELIGGEIQIPEQERVPPPAGYYYHSDLMGCRVIEGEQELGRVSGLFETGVEGVNLVVETSGGGEFMIPLVGEFIEEVDVEQKTIRVSLPPGLLELAES